MRAGHVTRATAEPRPSTAGTSERELEWKEKKSIECSSDFHPFIRFLRFHLVFKGFKEVGAFFWGSFSPRGAFQGSRGGLLKHLSVEMQVYRIAIEHDMEK